MAAVALVLTQAEDTLQPIPVASSQVQHEPHNTQLGCTYHPLTSWCDFAVDVRSNVASVELVVRRCDTEGRYLTSSFPMQRLNSTYESHTGESVAPPARWFISVSGLTPGDQYTFTLRDAWGNVLADQVSDPYALASTPLAWRPTYIARIKDTLEQLRENGESDDSLLERFYKLRYQSKPEEIPESLRSIDPTSADIATPWSFVIDKSQFLEPHKVHCPHPHSAGEREVVKFHPLMSVGVEDRWISDPFKDKRSTVEVLLCPLFRSYLKQLVNAIEFFPLTPRVSDPALVALGRENVWGYMPSHLLGLGSENFSSKDPHQQIRSMQEIVYALKQDGFSVIADIVSGHTAEAYAYSLRHLDPHNYFLLSENGTDFDVTGCGNTINPFSPSTHNLLKAQSKFYVDLLGMERRIDQAAVLGLNKSNESDFNPHANLLREILALSPNPIGEFMHAKGHFTRLVPEDVAVTSWDFWLRNLQYAIAFGESSMWPGSNPRQYRAFIASGSCGGVHTLQNLQPWSKNRSIQVFPHDGETVWDRARWAAVRSLHAELSPDPVFAELVERINSLPADYDALHREQQPRYMAMLEAIEYLKEEHPEKMAKAQGAAARWFLTQLYITPGDILMVAGDHACRSQDGSSNAYSHKRHLERALSPTASRHEAKEVQEIMQSNIEDGALLLHKLQTLRRRFDFIFHNTSIVDGVRRSSKDPSLAPGLSWYNTNGVELSSDEWSDTSSPFFLGWCYSAYPVHNLDSSVPHSRLFFADASSAEKFRLPDPGPWRVWRHVLNSCNPSDHHSATYRWGDTYHMPTCGIVVFESVFEQ